MSDVNETTVGSEEMKRVIDRVQKLLTRSKTSRGNSESEAETAMRLAQDLMSKYNLDMAEIEAASTNKETAAERVKEETKGRAMYKWQRQLAKYVAEANFCYHIIKSGYTWVPRHWSDEEPVEGAGLYSRFNGVVPASPTSRRSTTRFSHSSQMLAMLVSSIGMLSKTATASPSARRSGSLVAALLMRRWRSSG